MTTTQGQQVDDESPTVFEQRQAIRRLTKAIVESGVQLDMGLLQVTAQAAAACTALVQAGICTHDEMQVAVLTNVKAQLAEILQAIEQQKLQTKQQTQGLQVVKRPELVIAKH